MRDGIHDGLGNLIPARARQAMVDAREPLLGGPVACCTVPDCLRDARTDGLCIADLEVREISRPYGLDPRELQLADDCLCLIHKKTGALVQPCESHQRQADREAGA